MKKISYLLLCLFILCSDAYSLYKYEEKFLKTKIFFNKNDKEGKNAIIKGKIISISSSEEVHADDLSGSSHVKTKASIRLFTRENVYPTTTMYVIDPSNIVVSKLEIKYMFNSTTLGDMAVAYGNFALSNPGYRVAQIEMDSGKKDSFLLKSRGDYFERTGDSGKAIEQYKKAIESDPEDPSAHLGLGLIYYKDSIFNFAYSELSKAYKHKDRLYDNEDKFILLKSLAEIRFIETYDNYNIMENRIKFRKEGIKYCKEALRINPSSIDVNFLLGEFYYRGIGPDSSDEDSAKERYQKVTELYPIHPKANLRLANIFLKNNKPKMAHFYAKKALDGDPGNQEAMEILKRLQ